MSDDSDGLSDAVGDSAVEPQHSGHSRLRERRRVRPECCGGGGRVGEIADVCAAQVSSARPHPARDRTRSSPTLLGAFAALLACCPGRMHPAWSWPAGRARRRDRFRCVRAAAGARRGRRARRQRGQGGRDELGRGRRGGDEEGEEGDWEEEEEEDAADEVTEEEATRRFEFGRRGAPSRGSTASGTTRSRRCTMGTPPSCTPRRVTRRCAAARDGQGELPEEGPSLIRRVRRRTKCSVWRACAWPAGNEVVDGTGVVSETPETG
eukprot:2262357-Prymnesium_polylepis.1